MPPPAGPSREEVNLAVNQTLVRSINTMMVAILPVGAILFIGAGLLGAGTLRDLSLALFVGILIGTAATIFVAAPHVCLAAPERTRPRQAGQARGAPPERGGRQGRRPPPKPRPGLTRCSARAGPASGSLTLRRPVRI